MKDSDVYEVLLERIRDGVIEKMICGSRPSTMKRYHVAAFVTETGEIDVAECNNYYGCAERRLIQRRGWPAQPCWLALARVRNDAFDGSFHFLPSQPCGKCRADIVMAPDHVKGVVWTSGETEFETSVPPCSLPFNTYNARNMGPPLNKKGSNHPPQHSGPTEQTEP